MDRAQIDTLVDRFRSGELTRRSFIRNATALGVSAGVAGRIAGDVQAQDASEVIIAINTDWESMDPHEDTNNPYIFQNIFDSLVGRDQDLQIIPELAESWENIDELTWEFKLRQDVVFHDGTPMTAEDVAFTFNHILDPDVGSRSQPFIAMIDRAEVVDDYTVRLITVEPYPPLVDTTLRVFIVPAKAFQEMGAAEFAVNPVGTGEYRFVEWVRDDHALFERFEDNWRSEATIDFMRTRPIAETSTRGASVIAGEADIARRIAPSDAASFAESDGVEVREVRGLRIFFGMINTLNGGPLAEVKVRQAMNYAVDVEGIIEHILYGYGYPVASVTGQASFGFNPNLEPYPYDPDRARELMAEAGYADGFQTTFDLPGGHLPAGEEVAQAMIGFLADIGITAELQTAPFEQYWAAWLAGEHQGLALQSWGDQTMNADGVMGGHLDSTRRGIYYHSPRSDELTQMAMAEFDDEKREAIYQELMAYLHEQCPWIFLWDEAQLFGVNSSLQWEPRADETIQVHTMSFT